jgi:hypothetical protein
MLGFCFWTELALGQMTRVRIKKRVTGCVRVTGYVKGERGTGYVRG